jgi:hypothetical protein
VAGPPVWMSTRGLLDLLAAAQAQRDQVLAALAGDELHWVARREWAAIVDKLAAGEPFRLRRGDELPAKHPARRQGRRDDLLVLREDDELGVLINHEAGRRERRRSA